MAKEKQIGEITHYFGQIGVGVIELSADLKTGEEIRVQGGERDFTQGVKYMQIEHQSIEKAKKGDAVGLKFEERVKPGDRVYKVA